jgi:hypothetical protein
MKLFRCNGCPSECELRTRIVVKISNTCIRTGNKINDDRGWKEVKLISFKKSRADYTRHFEVIKERHEKE